MSNAAALYATIRPNTRVTIRTPHGQTRQGRAVMRGPAGWVLNLGGRYGTPGIACEQNLVAVGGRHVEPVATARRTQGEAGRV
jgi:hypothetical protein